METIDLRQLATLLRDTRVLSLGVLVDGAPHVGVMPFLAAADLGTLLVHSSRLAKHSRGLVAGALVSAAIHQPDAPELDPLRLPRLLLDGIVEELTAAEVGQAAAAWVARFPSAAMTVDLGDFTFHHLRPQGGRLVAGFGRAFGLGPHVFAAAAALERAGDPPT